MANHVKNLVRGMEEALKEKEEMEEMEAYGKAMDDKKTSVTSRFDSLQLAYLDMMAEKLEVSRSSLVCELASSALMDVMEEMGLTQEFYDRLKGSFSKKEEK